MHLARVCGGNSVESGAFLEGGVFPFTNAPPYYFTIHTCMHRRTDLLFPHVLPQAAIALDRTPVYPAVLCSSPAIPCERTGQDASKLWRDRCVCDRRCALGTQQFH